MGSLELGGAIKMAIKDAILTCGWMFCSSALPPIALVAATAIGVEQDSYWWHVLNTCLIMVLIMITDLMTFVLGGASFNPAANAAFYAAGLPGDTLVSMAVRFPAQALGAVGGAIAISEVMPSQYKHMLGGPSIKVDLHTAAMAEGVLTFIITFVVLIIMLRIPGSMLVKTWLLAMATITLVVLGSTYTGPSMNPANAFGWAYMQKKHNTWDQFYVYWICPFIGAISAAWVFRLIFPQPGAKKQKRAPKTRKAD